MATLTGNVLPSSTNGRLIKVAAISSPGTTIHTAVAGTTGFDEVWLWVTNSSALPVALTVQFGGTSSPDDEVVSAVSIPANSGPTLIVPGLRLNNGLVVKAFAGTTNVLLLAGCYNRQVSV